MRNHYDFSGAKPGPVITTPGKTRITIMLDNDVVEFFRARAEAAGTGYQTMINAELRLAIARSQGPDAEPLTVEKLREVLREELRTV